MEHINNIDYDELMDIIREQFVNVMNESYDYYKSYDISLSSEQQFVRMKDKKPNMIYIVVKFLGASLNFGQSVVPTTFTVLSEQDKLDVAQRLMLEYSQQYDLKFAADETIQQIYESPQVVANFNAVFSGFRTLLRMGGTFVISKSSNSYKIFYTYEEDGETKKEEIKSLTSSVAYTAQPDSQGFYNTKNFTRTEVSLGTLMVNCSTFLLIDSRFVKDVITAVNKKKSEKTNVNKRFNLEVRFREDEDLTFSGTYKLINMQIPKNIGEIPVMAVSFSE